MISPSKTLLAVQHIIMNNNRGKYIIIGLIILLMILHHDIWNWGKKEPDFGFMPVALLWQALISIGAGITWFIATKIAWPTFEEETATEPAAETQEGAE